MPKQDDRGPLWLLGGSELLDIFYLCSHFHSAINNLGLFNNPKWFSISQYAMHPDRHVVAKWVFFQYVTLHR